MTGIFEVKGDIYFHISRSSNFNIGETYSTDNFFKEYNNQKKIVEDSIESIRVTKHPDYPDRHKCLFVIEANNKNHPNIEPLPAADAYQYLLRRLGLFQSNNPYRTYKIQCYGKMLIRSMDTYDDIYYGQKDPKEYWSKGTFDGHKEGLFIGEFKILDIIDQRP